ncbi:putative mitochondrial carrier protein [Aspergillus undulatus]|uniref:putative mitochondrial carrier protein n=1 Tax=Aspergillus undulatus TaxID=1810928 RepID=UPI003CCCD986
MQSSALDIWISGAVAVVTVDFLVYPFDTLKTRIQSPDYNRIYKDGATNTVKKNVLFRGLYQGVVSVVLSTIPASGAFFTTYETVKSTLNQHITASSSSSQFLNANANPAITPLINGLASCTGEAVSCLLLTPAEVLKQNAQVINKSSPSTTSNTNTKSQGASEGWRRSVTLQVLSRFRSHPWRLWSGYSALLGRNLPFTGLNFPIFEGVKGVLVRRRRERLGLGLSNDKTSAGKGGSRDSGGKVGEEPVFERAVLTGLAASISGSIASVITTPIDVVKTRMMLAATGTSTSDSASTDTGSGPSSEAEVARNKNKGGQNVWSVGRRIFRDEGVKGLFRGGAIRVVWTAVSLSIYLSMYEGGRFYLEKRRARKAEAEESY